MGINANIINKITPLSYSRGWHIAGDLEQAGDGSGGNVLAYILMPPLQADLWFQLDHYFFLNDNGADLYGIYYINQAFDRYNVPIYGANPWHLEAGTLVAGPSGYGMPGGQMAQRPRYLGKVLFFDPTPCMAMLLPNTNGKTNHFTFSGKLFIGDKLTAPWNE